MQRADLMCDVMHEKQFNVRVSSEDLIRMETR